MTEEEIKEVEEFEEIEVLEEVDGTIINLDTNEELIAMGKGEEEDEQE